MRTLCLILAMMSSIPAFANSGIVQCKVDLSAYSPGAYAIYEASYDPVHDFTSVTVTTHSSRGTLPPVALANGRYDEYTGYQLANEGMRGLMEKAGVKPIDVASIRTYSFSGMTKNSHQSITVFSDRYQKEIASIAYMASAYVHCLK